MRLSQLRDFVGIVDAGSIRAAARTRGVSQPVLTKSLRGLEAVVGSRLLHRTTQGIVLTAAGRVLLARARAAQTQLAKAREEIAEIAGHRASSVAFGASASGLVLVPPALSAFYGEYPLAQVRVVEGSFRALAPLLRDETLDFFIGPSPAEKVEPQLRVRPLFRLPVGVAARRGHPLGQSRSLRDLADSRWLLLSTRGWGDSLLSSAFAAARLPAPPALIQCESYAVTMMLLAQTDTLALIPRAHMNAPGARGLLAEVPITDRLPELSFSIFQRADDKHAPASLALLRSLAGAAREMMRATRREAD